MASDFMHVAPGSALAVHTFGAPHSGALARGAGEPGFPPQPVPKLLGKRVTALAAGARSLLAVSGGAGTLYVAGANEEGQLAPDARDEAGARVHKLYAPLAVEALGAHRVTAAAVGTSHAVALLEGGIAMSFGSNEFRALGHAPAADAPVYGVPPRVMRLPRELPGGGGSACVVQVACGSAHTLLLTRSGVVLAVGSGLRGALGSGSTADAPTAAPVGALTGVPAAFVATGDHTSYAVTVGGAAWAWGANKYGQLGLPPSAHGQSVLRPALVTDGLPEPVRLVAAGDAHAAWVGRSGRVYSAGRNTHGQLGLLPPPGTPPPASYPICCERPTLVRALEGHRVTQVACGSEHTLLLTAGGDVFACGDSSEGQTGVLLPALPGAPPPPGGEMDRTHVRGACLWAPTRIPSLSGRGVVSLVAGGYHSAALVVASGEVLAPLPGVLPARALGLTDGPALQALARSARDTGDAGPLRAAIRDVLGSWTALAGSFYSPDAPPEERVSLPRGGCVAVVRAAAAPSERAPAPALASPPARTAGEGGGGGALSSGASFHTARSAPSVPAPPGSPSSPSSPSFRVTDGQAFGFSPSRPGSAAAGGLLGRMLVTMPGGLRRQATYAAGDAASAAAPRMQTSRAQPATAAPAAAAQAAPPSIIASLLRAASFPLSRSSSYAPHPGGAGSAGAAPPAPVAAGTSGGGGGGGNPEHGPVEGVLPHEAPLPAPPSGATGGAGTGGLHTLLLPPLDRPLSRAGSYTGSVVRGRAGSAEDAAGDAGDISGVLGGTSGAPMEDEGDSSMGSRPPSRLGSGVAVDAAPAPLPLRLPDGTTQEVALVETPPAVLLPSEVGAALLAPTPDPPGPYRPLLAGIYPSSARVDVVGLEAATTAALAGRDPDVLAELLRAGAAVLDEMEPAVKSLGSHEALRAFLPLLLSPTNARPAHSAANLARTCACVLGLPQVARDTLVEWLADVPPALFRARLVRPMVAHVDYHLKLALGGAHNAPVATSRPPGGGARVTSLTHVTALEVVVRVLRLLYQLNARLAEQAEAALGLPPHERPPRASAAIEAHRRASLYGADEPHAIPGAPLGALVPPEEFASPGVSALPDEVLVGDLHRWRQAGYRRVLATPIILLNYPFLLDAAAKRRVLLLEAALTMQSEANSAVARSLMGRPGEAPFLVLHVRRSHVLSDTLNQLVSQPRNLRKQLKVSFHGEEALDAGGVTKELFQLLTKELLDPRYGLFVFNEATRDYWLSPAWYAQALAMGLPTDESALGPPRAPDVGGDMESFFLAGMLIGLAIYNGTQLDLRLPRTVFKKLLIPPPGHASVMSSASGMPALHLGLADLRDVNPLLASGLQQLLAYEGGDDEEVFGLTFEATLEAFGAPISVPLVPGGASMRVTASNKWDYAAALVEWHLRRSVARAFAALQRGFFAVLPPHVLGILRPEELELLVAGTCSLDFTELEAVTAYDGGFTPVHPTVKAFWRVAHALSEEDKRRLLVFVTASPRAPIGGLRNLRFKLQRNGPDSDRLPTASTCFNTLLLPDYANEDRLRDRLKTAIAECSGFGLK